MSTNTHSKSIQTTGSFRAIPVDVPGNLANIRIVLFEPREPGNIGSVARVVKGMGAIATLSGEPRAVPRCRCGLVYGARREGCPRKLPCR